MNTELLQKINDVIDQAIESENRFAVWRGKLTESDDIEWKIFINADYDNHEGDLLIRVKKR
jgi:hypothetical protein